MGGGVIWGGGCFGCLGVNGGFFFCIFMQCCIFSSCVSHLLVLCVVTCYITGDTTTLKPVQPVDEVGAADEQDNVDLLSR